MVSLRASVRHTECNPARAAPLSGHIDLCAVLLLSIGIHAEAHGILPWDVGIWGLKYGAKYMPKVA
jgi:hypothetical protein